MSHATNTISHRHLADLVAMLLLNPDHVGELDTTDKHMEFARDIASVVCDYCGGELVGEADQQADHVTVQANDSLPEDGGVWQRIASNGNWRGAAAAESGSIIVDVVSYNRTSDLVTARVTHGGAVATKDYRQSDVVAAFDRYAEDQDVSDLDPVICALAQIRKDELDKSSWARMVGKSFTIA